MPRLHDLSETSTELDKLRRRRGRSEPPRPPSAPTLPPMSSSDAEDQARAYSKAYIRYYRERLDRACLWIGKSVVVLFFAFGVFKLISDHAPSDVLGFSLPVLILGTIWALVDWARR